MPAPSSIEPTYYDSETMTHWNGNEYYTLDGHNTQSKEPVIYVGGFPLEWATAHECGTGPMECVNCAYYGSLNGVFVGYCVNCAQNVYKGSRGLGFLGDGHEDCEGNPQETCGFGESAFKTYLKTMTFDMFKQVSRQDVIMKTTEEEYDNMLATTYRDAGGPFNSDYEGGYNDF